MFYAVLYTSCFFFFFKQKTAYEMRISDWSSDVCSSDLRFTCLPRIVRPQDALDRQWPAPAGGEPLHVLPRQGSVELAVHIIVQRGRSVGHRGDAMGAVYEIELPPEQSRWRTARHSRHPDKSERTTDGTGTRVSVLVARGGRRNVKNKKQRSAYKQKKKQ